MGYKFSGRNSKGLKWVESHKGMIAYQRGTDTEFLRILGIVNIFVSLNESSSTHYKKVNVLIKNVISSSLHCDRKSLENLCARKETVINGDDI